jgi:predicted aminopeptidase
MRFRPLSFYARTARPGWREFLRRAIVAVLITAGAALFHACSPGYVLQAGYQEAKILWRREPITELLNSSRFDGALSAKLDLVLRVRAFAEETLGLRVGGSYATYARLDPDQVVHVVTAAERFRLEPYTWWFPIVGRVPYKGFFSAAEAQALAAQLELEGYDTYVRASAAFSTLGWFDDPLLSTTLQRDPIALVETVLHELLHNTKYIGGHANFDESFANFVGHRGAILFFEQARQPDALQEATRRWEDALRFAQFLADVFADLDKAYTAGVTLAEREDLFGHVQRRFAQIAFHTDLYSGFGTVKLNNAILLHEQLYFDRLRLFEAVHQELGADLPSTIRKILESVARSDMDPYASLSELERPPEPELTSDFER